jgi:four helix bundle protein
MGTPMPASVKTSPAVYFLLSTFWTRGYNLTMAFAFEKLQVYQKAVAFADAICSLTKGFPRGYFFLADQLNRAALSIAANIAEGNGRFTTPDRKNFFGIARGSVQECVPLLELASRQELLEPSRQQQMKADLEEIARMLSGLINGLDKRKT